MKVSSVLVIAIAGCGGTAPAPPRAPPPAVVEIDAPAEAQPAPRTARPPIEDTTTWTRDPGRRDLLSREAREEMILRESHKNMRRPPPDVALAESQFWDPCVRQFVGAQSELARRALTTAFSRYATACDRDGRVVLQLTRGVDGRERRGKSDVGFVGTFTMKRIDLSLRIAYCGQPPPIADHVVIASDDGRWTSNELDFERDEHGCEVAELPITRALRRALHTATESTDAVVRFEGKRGEDLAIGEDMKQDMRVMLDALDALEP